MHDGVLEMHAPIELVELPHEAQTRTPADDDRVEKAVVGTGIGRNGNPAAKASGVRQDRQHQGTFVHGFSIHAYRRWQRPKAHHGSKDGQKKRHRTAKATEPPEPAPVGIGESHNTAAGAETHLVREPRRPLASVRIPAKHAPGVHRSGFPSREGFHRRLGIEGQPEAADQVATGPEGQQADLCRVPEPGGKQSRHHLGDGSIAPGHDDPLHPGTHGFPSNAHGVPGGARRLHLEGAEHPPEPLLELRPPPGVATAAASGIEHDQSLRRHGRKGTRGSPTRVRRSASRQSWARSRFSAEPARNQSICSSDIEWLTSASSRLPSSWWNTTFRLRPRARSASPVTLTRSVSRTFS